jgi:alpha-beta hydrolase superfamily lysophospholipase
VDFQPDVLAGFVAASLGNVTVVRPDALPASPRAAVLHVHGYNDYFYQTELAQWFAQQGLAFYAVDMRRSGRSLKSGDHPHDMADIAEQGEDISAAVAAIAADSPGLPIVVHAHSTGALAAAIWAADHPDPAVAGVILNSPLFGLQTNRRDRAALVALPLIKRVRPRMVVGDRPAIYAKHLHASGGGPAQFDIDWKTPAGVPARAQWVHAVSSAWKRIDAGLGIELPVLVARSDSSGPESDDNPRIMEQDVVVDTAATARRTPLLGPGAREVVIENGIHDLSQSSEGPRAAYYAAVAGFIDEVLA